MRGLFSAGIMDVMLENNITFDGVIGVSAGAAFGCNYKSRQIGRAIRYNKRFARDKRYCSMQSFLRTGDLFGAEYAYHVVPNEYDIFDNETFEQNPTEFWVVCTDVETGEPVYKRLDKVDGDCYELDGGMSDSIPLKAFQRRGFERNLVIMTQPRGYVKKPSRLLPVIRLSLRKYPRVVETMQMRHLMYNDQLAYVEQEVRRGNTMAIYPDAALPIGHISHDPEEMQRVYDIGRETGLRKLDDIKSFLDS